MTKEEIKNSIKVIQDAMNEQATIDSPHLILEKLNNCTNLIGLSAEVYAWSEKYYNESLGALILKKEYLSLTATDKKMLFASLLSEEIRVHTTAERLNAGLVHSIDSLRSMLSFLKEEYKRIA